jgi:hypothetical protein
MPKIETSLKTSGATWTPSDILNRWGSNYSRLSAENPAFDLGRINNRGYLEFQKDKAQERIITRFQIGDYVSGKRLDDGESIRGKIVSITTDEGSLDKIYIIHNGNRVRIDAGSIVKLAESSICSFTEFVYILESTKK